MSSLRRAMLGRARRTGSALVITFLCTTAPTHAQVLKGRLLDEATAGPVPGATLELLNDRGRMVGRTLSDSLGVFFLDADLGQYQIRAQRLGYHTTLSIPFQIPVADTVVVEFWISAEAIPMAPIFVTVPRRPGHEVFTERPAHEEGVFFTPEMVDSLRPETHIGEIFRNAEKTWVRWTWGRREDGSTGPIPGVYTYMGRYGCLNYVVNRTPVPAPFFEQSIWGVPPLSDVEPDDVAAIEVYRAWHEVPEDFWKEIRVRNAWEREALKRINRKTCGLVVIWTKDAW